MALLFFLVFIPVAAIGATLQRKFLNRLRSLYPDVWSSLGSPSFWNNSPKNNLSTLKYLLKAEFRCLDDHETVRSGERLRTYTIAYLTAFGVWLVIALIWTICIGSGES